MVFQDKLTRRYLVFSQLKKVRQDKNTKRITTMQLAIKQYTPMKYLEINYQKHKSRQSIIGIQVHDKLHEKWFIYTCSFLWINELGWECVQKSLRWKTHLLKRHILYVYIGIASVPTT